jgi:hypothetical protein
MLTWGHQKKAWQLNKELDPTHIGQSKGQTLSSVAHATTRVEGSTQNPGPDTGAGYTTMPDVARQVMELSQIPVAGSQLTTVPRTVVLNKRSRPESRNGTDVKAIASGNNSVLSKNTVRAKSITQIHAD